MSKSKPPSVTVTVTRAVPKVFAAGVNFNVPIGSGDVYSIATSIVGLALLGVQTCVASVAYLDVRVRTEGLDLDIDLAKVFS